jgi:hypothetical protein
VEKLYNLASILKDQQQIVELIIKNRNDVYLNRLGELVFQQENLNDKAVMSIIYYQGKNTSFSKLKAELKEIFYQAILIFNDKIGKADFRSEQELGFDNILKTLVGRILMGKLNEDTGTQILEKTINQAIKYSITENVLMQSRYLKIVFGSTRPNNYKFIKYRDLQKEAIKTLFWEMISEDYYLELQNYTIRSTANPAENLKIKARKYFEELNQVSNIKSPLFIYNKYRVQSVLNEYESDYIGLLQTCDEALNYFESIKFKTTIIFENINVRKTFALIQIGKYDEAIDFGREKISEIISGTKVWVRISYYTFKAFIYRSKYREGIKILLMIIENTNLKKLGQIYFEFIQVLLGYIHLLINAGYIDLESYGIGQLPDFKIGKFLNNIPVYSKDKRGINVSILLMHIAFLLQRKDYDAIIDRTDSLNQYAYRYLRRDDSFRSNCMIKMVIQMTKADFNPVRTERYTADLLKQLKAVKLAGSGENIEIEVIPFEVLWEIMLKSLKN